MGERKGPGSEEGFGEALHWGSENGQPSKAQRAWLLEQARERTDPRKYHELARWITNGRRSRKDVRGLCKRWGIELPDDNELNK